VLLLVLEGVGCCIRLRVARCVAADVHAVDAEEEGARLSGVDDDDDDDDDDDEERSVSCDSDDDGSNAVDRVEGDDGDEKDCDDVVVVVMMEGLRDLEEVEGEGTGNGVRGLEFSMQEESSDSTSMPILVKSTLPTRGSIRNTAGTPTSGSVRGVNIIDAQCRKRRREIVRTR
jgi:hypothetical protein